MFSCAVLITEVHLTLNVIKFSVAVWEWGETSLVRLPVEEPWNQTYVYQLFSSRIIMDCSPFYRVVMWFTCLCMQFPALIRNFIFFVTFPSFLIHIFFWIFKLEWRLAVLSCTSEIDVLFTPKEDDLKKPSGLSIKKKQLQELEKGGDEIYSRHSYTIKAKTLLSFFFFFLNKMTVRFIKGVLSLNVI